MKGTAKAALVALVAFLCLVGFQSTGYSLEFGARAYYWFPGLKANMKVDQGGTAGTDINVKDDLGVDNKGIPAVEVYAGKGKHHFSLMYSQVHYSGSATLSRDITFKGSTFTAGTAVQSDLKTRMLDFEYQYDLLNLENILAGFSIGAIGKVKYLDGEAEMKSATVDQKETFGVPIPMVGLGAHLGLLANILEARAKATGMGYGGNVFYDAMADISVTPFPFMDIHGGYRIMKLKVDNVSNVFVDTEFSGPYLGLTVGF